MEVWSQKKPYLEKKAELKEESGAGVTFVFFPQALHFSDRKSTSIVYNNKK